MNSCFNFHLGYLLFLMGFCSCWQYFTSLTDLTLTDSDPEQLHTHSEYIFGDCKRPDKKFFAHVHKDNMEVLGKVIIRGWLNLTRIPNCIILRATAYEEDMFRSTAFRFQICVPRISICQSTIRYKYYYYEWYIPPDVINAMNWDIYFYGLSFRSMKMNSNGWLHLYRIPTCILLRATAYEEDTFRSTAFRFQICVPRITYCHSQKRFKYYFYEWYIPADMIGGMNWDIYFYGPTNLEWQ